VFNSTRVIAEPSGSLTSPESDLFTGKEVTAPTNFPQTDDMINIMQKGGIK
jgi:hypothetical protein